MKFKLDLIQPTSKGLVKHKNDTNTKQADLKKINEGDRVWVRNYRSGQKWDQGKVIEKIGQTMYKVKVNKGTWRRHAHQLSKTNHSLKTLTFQAHQKPMKQSLPSQQGTQHHLKQIDDTPCTRESKQTDTVFKVKQGEM